MCNLEIRENRCPPPGYVYDHHLNPALSDETPNFRKILSLELILYFLYSFLRLQILRTSLRYNIRVETWKEFYCFVENCSTDVQV